MMLFFYKDTINFSLLYSRNMTPYIITIATEEEIIKFGPQLAKDSEEICERVKSELKEGETGYVFCASTGRNHIVRLK